MPSQAVDSTKLRAIVLKCLGSSSEQLDDTFLDYVTGVLSDDPQLANDIHFIHNNSLFNTPYFSLHSK